MKAIHTLLGLALLCGVPVIATGCFEAEDTEGEDVDVEASVEDDDPIYTVTRVDLDDSGNQVVSWETIRRSEQIAMNALEETETSNGVGQTKQGLTKQSVCTGSTIRLYSDFNYTGDVICFSGNGEADLNDYCRVFIGGCVDKWSGDVRSFKNNSIVSGALRFYSAANASYAAGGACCFHCGERASGALVPDANACEEGARFISRGTCNPGPCVP